MRRDQARQPSSSWSNPLSVCLSDLEVQLWFSLLPTYTLSFQADCLRSIYNFSGIGKLTHDPHKSHFFPLPPSSNIFLSPLYQTFIYFFPYPSLPRPPPGPDPSPYDPFPSPPQPTITPSNPSLHLSTSLATSPSSFLTARNSSSNSRILASCSSLLLSRPGNVFARDWICWVFRIRSVESSCVFARRVSDDDDSGGGKEGLMVVVVVPLAAVAAAGGRLVGSVVVVGGCCCCSCCWVD